jgi:gluconokinase
MAPLDKHLATTFIIMGVSGCGKSTVGVALAAALGCPFYDGDDFHPAENVARMAAGIPLRDADRIPWLDRLNGLVREHEERGETAVIACSALKKSYRERLRAGTRTLQFIFLDGDPDLIRHRLENRPGHFMQPALLKSQLDILERPGPEEAIAFNPEMSVAAIVAAILSA